MEYKFISPNYRIDRKLYKYFSNIEFAIDSIKYRRIHLDMPRQFNDPFEARICINSYTNNAKRTFLNSALCDVIKLFANYYDGHIKHCIIKKACRILDNIPESWTGFADVTTYKALCEIYKAFGNVDFSLEEFCDIVNESYAIDHGWVLCRCKMSCFSEIWDSIPMWAYYAGSHAGVCIEYDLSRLDLNKELNREIIRNISKVHYTPVRVDLGAMLVESEDLNGGLNFMISKADAWEHEHEWRIICETEEEYLPFDCISKIYLGVNFPKDSERYNALVEAVKSYENLNIYKCVLDAHEYKLAQRVEYDSLLMRWISTVTRK